MSYARNAMSVVLVGLVCGFTGTAQAVTIIFSDTVSDTQLINFTGTGTQTASLNLTMTLPQFNPALGTLTAVSWSDMYVDPDFSFTYTNNNGSEVANIEGGISTENLSFTEFPLDFGIGVVGSAFGFVDVIGPGGSNTPSLPNPFGPIGLSSSDPGLLALYTGLGTVTATRNADGIALITDISGLTDPNDLSTSGSYSWEWTRTITYTFDPAPAVPEPITATLGLMGLGVLGLATRRRAA